MDSTVFKVSRRPFERVLGCERYVGSLEGVIGRERGRSVNDRTIQEGVGGYRQSDVKLGKVKE